MPANRPDRIRAYAGLVLATLFWAGNAVLARGVAEEIRPFALAFWRWAAALVVLLPFGLPRLKGAGDTVRAAAWPLFWMGLLSVGAFNTLLYIAARTTTALNITLVNSTMPIFIAILAHFILGARTTRRQLLGFTCAAIGMVAIVARGEWSVLAEFAFNPGDLVMILAVLAWGIYSVLLRHWRIELHPLAFLTVIVAIGVALLLPFFVWEVATRGHFAWSPVHLPMFAFLAIFPSILAFLFWNRGVEVLGPSATGMFIYMVPVFAAVLGYWLLGEVLRGYHGVGGAMILAGLYLATRAPGGESVAPGT